MDGKLQARINPPAAPGTFSIGPGKVSGQATAPAIDGEGAGTKTEFKDLLFNSNRDKSRERAAKKNGDLSGAKSDEEFFAQLQEQTEAKKRPKPSANLDKEAFMKLFVTQLQNQDPLNPDDSAKMAAQLAQFHGLEQMMNVNQNLETMTKADALGRAVNLVDFVGREVTLESGKLRYESGEVTDAVVQIGGDVPEAILEVRDGAGVIVAEESLGNLSAGENPLEWSGRNKDGHPIADGIYTFTVTGTDLSGATIPATIRSTVKVTGVDLQTEGGGFFTELGEVDVRDIASVGDPGFRNKLKSMSAPLAGEKTQASASPKNPVADVSKDPKVSQVPVPPGLASLANPPLPTRPVANRAANISTPQK